MMRAIHEEKTQKKGEHAIDKKQTEGESKLSASGFPHHS